MALNFNNVNAITIPEGEVKEISINGTTVWQAPYIWATLDIGTVSKTMGSTSNYQNIVFTSFPTNAISLKITLSYSQTPNSYTYYETNIDTLSMDTVTNSLRTDRPDTLTIPLDGSTYLFAVRYRSYRQNSETYMRYWYLDIYDDHYLELKRDRQDDVGPTNSIGMYPVTITKVEALIPNPDLQA